MKIKKNKLSYIIFALIIALFAVCFVSCEAEYAPDEPLPEPPEVDPALQLTKSLYVANIAEVTPEDDGFKYKDDDTEIILTPIDEEDAKKEIEEAERAVVGESGEKKWTSVKDKDGNESIYISKGDETVKAKVVSKPKGDGIEKSAAKAAALVQNKAAYTKGTRDYNENYAKHYIEFADCILYYPAQLSAVKAYENNTAEFSDTRSRAKLKLSYEKNPYTSMDEVEGFIAGSENNTILAYGPSWYSAEMRGKDITVFTYVGLGENYIVEAELTYENAYGFVFEELRKLIKCKFIGDGIWVSEEKADSYYDERSAFNGRFSTATVAYYSSELGAIMLYPEMFSLAGDCGADDYASFIDPLGGARIYLSVFDDGITMKSYAEHFGYTDSSAISENAIIAENSESGMYSYAYFGGKRIAATVYYPPEFGWVYENLLPEIKIIPAEDFYDNTEMQDIIYDDVGCRITIPLQFEELGFYDGIANFEDSSTGIVLSVTFEEITDNEQKTNIFACFDVAAEDEDILVGENHISWMNNMGYNYGARGNYSAAQLTIHAPNAPTVYRSTLPYISVEFVSEKERVATEEEEIREKENPPETKATETKAQTKAPETKAPETKPATASPETEAQKTTVDIEIPKIFAAGLGELLTERDSPLVDMLLNVDANQIVKGDLNMFRLIGEEDDISDEDVDIILDTTRKLVELGFNAFTEELMYFKSYVFHGTLNGRFYIIGFTFEYFEDNFSWDDQFNFIYDGPGDRLYMTIITDDPKEDPGDVFFDYDITKLDHENNPDFFFEILYQTAWAQRMVVEDLKENGEFDPDYIFLIERAKQVYDDLDFEDWHLEYVGDDNNYDQLIISYGKYNGLGYFEPGGRYIYNANENPTTIDDNDDFEYEEYNYSEVGDYYTIWSPYEEVDEIYDFWAEKAEIDNFFDELERELFEDYYDFTELPNIYGN